MANVIRANDFQANRYTVSPVISFPHTMQRLNKLEVALYHRKYATENTRKRFYKCLNTSVNYMIYIFDVQLQMAIVLAAL